MGETVGALLAEGLRITAIGLAWVFAGLALVWGLVGLLNRLFPGSIESPARSSGTIQGASTLVEASVAEALTAERAQVAAVVAAALLANSLPIHVEAPVGPTFEHGRTAPNWVTGNRARALQSWQPPRRPVD
jgi:Na+-transporting methylmalonyl-CoA/oxaloacetate decarboxylase gamma subunit